MVSLTALWLPILVSAVFVFVLSSVIHMVLGYHADDFQKLPGEAEVMETLRRAGVPPGEYVLPHAGSTKEMSDPVYLEKVREGPVAILSVAPGGSLGMGRSLLLWFVYSLVVGAFAGYVTGRALPPGAEYLDVFRFAGTTALIGYTLALWQNPIWYHRKLSTTLKSTFDGAVYALATAGVFGWLWPG